MTAIAAATPATDRHRTVNEALAVLGLDEDATSGEIETAHAELVAYLEDAPLQLHGWAADQIARVDAAHDALTGLHAARPGAKPRRADRDRGQAPTDAAEDYLAFDADDPDELFEILSKPHKRDARDSRATRAAGTRGSARTAARDRSGVSTSLLGSVRRLGSSGGSRTLLLSGALLSAVLIGVFAIYKIGEPAVPGLSGTPAPAAAGGVDQAKVATFMEKLSKDNQDKAALQGLADLYYAAGDYANASTWLDKLLAIDPKNVNALLGAGAAAYNAGKLDVAEARWRAVLEAEPTNVEAHYDLGFMYLSQDPPALDKVRAEWNQVIAVDPTSDIAKTVASHLKSLDPSFSPPASSAAPSAAPSGPASPAPSASAQPRPS